MYYSGAKKWHSSFTEDVGDLFEQYVGRQLQQIPNAIVYPEIVYDKDNKKSVDWIVVCEDTVILVEVKSVRPTEDIRLKEAERRERDEADAWPSVQATEYYGRSDCQQTCQVRSDPGEPAPRRTDRHDGAL